VGALALLLVFAVGMALTAGAVRGDTAAQLRDVNVAGVVQLPGIMVIGGVVVAVTALLPRWAATVSWTVVIVSLLLGPLFGAVTMHLSEWALDLSPFTPRPKGADSRRHRHPRRRLMAISAVLASSALAWFRRRSLALPG
jgi:ABC-2 type transport system permease protein